MTEAPQYPSVALGLFARPEWSFGGRPIPTAMVQSVSGSLPAWVTPCKNVDAGGVCELVLVRELLPPAQVCEAIAAPWGQAAPPYRIVLFPEPEPTLTPAATIQAFDMVVGVESHRMDTVAEALAILSTGHLLIGADLGTVWDLVGRRSGIFGRAMVLDGIGDNEAVHVVQSWLHAVQSGGYGSGQFLMQVVKPEEHERLTLASLDSFACASLERCGDRPSMLTASLDATVTAVVVIAFRCPENALVPSEWSNELRDATREAIESALVLGDELCLKHARGAFGVIAADDINRGAMRVTDRHTGRTRVFEDADELLGAGWVID